MKKIKILIACVICAMTLPAVFANNEKAPVLKNKRDSLNYVLGLTTGNSLTQYYLQNDSTGEGLKAILKGIEDGLKDYSEFESLGKNVGGFLKQSKENGLMNNKDIEINFDLIKQGIINGLRGFEEQMTEDDAKSFLETTMQELQNKQNEELYSENKTAGEDFLAKNATEDGVVTTESGLQYKVLKAGKGKKPTESNTVKVHYHGTLLDGTVFDSSVERGEPIEFPVTGVIRGWTEALQLMPAGSKWVLYIPQDLAYGDRDTGKIKPYSTLIFEVELLEVK